jgi:hypothetical protein
MKRPMKRSNSINNGAAHCELVWFEMGITENLKKKIKNND